MTSKMSIQELEQIILVRFPHLLTFSVEELNLDLILSVIPTIPQNRTLMELMYDLYNCDYRANLKDCIRMSSLPEYGEAAEFLSSFYPYWVDMDALLAREDNLITAQELGTYRLGHTMFNTSLELTELHMDKESNPPVGLFNKIETLTFIPHYDDDYDEGSNTEGAYYNEIKIEVLFLDGQMLLVSACDVVTED